MARDALRMSQTLSGRVDHLGKWLCAIKEIGDAIENGANPLHPAHVDALEKFETKPANAPQQNLGARQDRPQKTTDEPPGPSGEATPPQQDSGIRQDRPQSETPISAGGATPLAPAATQAAPSVPGDSTASDTGSAALRGSAGEHQDHGLARPPRHGADR
jgi:hypothetical protein